MRPGLPIHTLKAAEQLPFTAIESQEVKSIEPIVIPEVDISVEGYPRPAGGIERLGFQLQRPGGAVLTRRIIIHDQHAAAVDSTAIAVFIFGQANGPGRIRVAGEVDRPVAAQAAAIEVFFKKQLLSGGCYRGKQQ